MANMLSKEGLTLKELEAQVGELLPKRLEMRHRRRVRSTNSCSQTIVNSTVGSAKVVCISGR